MNKKELKKEMSDLLNWVSDNFDDDIDGNHERPKYCWMDFDTEKLYTSNQVVNKYFKQKSKNEINN